MMKPLPFVLAAAALFLAIPPSAQSASPQAADNALLEQGKQIFTSRCAKCHDADATKKLPDGSTLLGRLAANRDPKARLATRLKSMSEQDGRAVVFYVEDLIARFRAARPASPADR